MWTFGIFQTFSNWLHRLSVKDPPNLEVRMSIQPNTHPPVFPLSVFDNKNTHFIPYVDPMREKLTVVLDMDGTLLHSVFMDPEYDYSLFSFDAVICDESNTYTFGVYIRPMLDSFLQASAEHFDLVLFTAAERTYARPVMNMIDPNGYIKHRFYRDSCISVDGVLIKPLQYLGRNMSRIVLVDNSEVCMLTAPDNGIHISNFTGDAGNEAITLLTNILSHIHNLDDVRPLLIQTFHMRNRLVHLGFTPLDGLDGPFN